VILKIVLLNIVLARRDMHEHLNAEMNFKQNKCS